MKRFTQGVLCLILLATANIISAQTPNQYIPELVFQNPRLVNGNAGENGARYFYSTVAAGIDAVVEIKGRSSNAVVLTDIDVANLGWGKAFQPQLGIQGDVAANQNWWMEFEIVFYNTGTNQKKKIKGFQVTAIDVDGDGVSIREYLQMNKVKSVAYCPVNYLVEGATVASLVGEDTDPDNNKGSNKMVVGPTQNFVNIDTSGTNVMATYTYEDKDKISFRFGGKSGSTISNAGERLNSLWFKAFSLQPPITLPVTFHNFTATQKNNNVLLDWTTDTDDAFSHYVVERSVDGEKFSDIGMVMTIPTVDEVNYQYKDLNVSSATGVLYYRLRWLFGKETSYSPVKIVRLGKEEGKIEVAIYPNPAKTSISVNIPSAWQQRTSKIEILTVNGVMVQIRNIKSAGQVEAVNLSSLPKGMYVVKISCDGASASKTIVKE